MKVYNEMRQRLKEKKEIDLKTTLFAEKEVKTVASALAQNDDDIVKYITDVKIQIAKDLDLVSEKRLTEFKKLAEIEKAVAIESKKMQELYEISHSAETLVKSRTSQSRQLMVHRSFE